MGAQKPITQPVEGAHPHAAHIDWQHARQTRQHLFSSLVGKGDSQHTTRRNLASLQQPSDAGREHAGFARTGTSQNKRVVGWQSYRSRLFVVEALQ